MATGEQTIAALATHTGIDHAHVQRTARILREVGADLWPQSGRGGGRRARHVQPHHLGNVVIALAVAEPITKGPNRVLLQDAKSLLAEPSSTPRHENVKLTGS